jgi:hypothetical protein
MQRFRRDSSGALINADHSVTIAYKQRRERMKKTETDINTLTNRIAQLEDMVQQLLRGTHDINN